MDYQLEKKKDLLQRYRFQRKKKNVTVRIKIVFDRLTHASSDRRLTQSVPTDPFTMLEPRDQEIGEFYEIQKLRWTDLEASKLWKGR